MHNLLGMPTLYNIKTDKSIPRDAICIMRPSKYSNPYKLKDYNDDRVKVLALYKDYLEKNPQLILDIKNELRGKDLVCCCYPKLCHGMILLQLANGD